MAPEALRWNLITMPKLHELREQRAGKVAEMRGLVDTATNDNGRELSDNERARFDALKGEVAGLENRISQAETLADLERRADAEPVTGEGDLTRLEQRVSLMEVLQAAIQQRPLRGAEAEYNRETERRTGRRAEGVFVPMALFERRANTTATAPQIVPNEHRPDLYIPALRDRLIIRALGARVLTGLRGDITIPKFGSGLSAAWVDENEAVPDSNMSFASVGLTPHHVGGTSELSRQLIMQSSPDVEQLVRDDLSVVIAEKIDQAAISGGATTKEPTGILRTSGIGVGSMATPSRAEALAAVEALDARRIPDTRTWLLDPIAKKTLSETIANPIRGEYLLDNGQLAGYSAQRTTRLPAASGGKGSALFGDFSQLLMGVWSELDILVNPYAEGPYRKGNVLVRAMATVDTAVRYPGAFQFIDDIPAAAPVV